MRDPDVLQVKQGGGCLTLFGLPFFLAGLFVLQIPLGLIPVKSEGGAGTMIVTFLFGLVFAAVGAGLVFGRSGVIVNRRMGKVFKWWGLLVPMKRAEYPIGLFQRVSLSRKAGDSDSPDTYPVTLEDGEGQTKVVIVRPAAYLEAHRAAEELAKLLSMPLEDTSSGEKVVREVDRIDESLRERAKRTREDLGSLPPAPPNTRTKIEQTGDGIILVIASPAGGLFLYLPLVFALLFAAFVANFFIRGLLELPGPPMVRYGFILFITIFFVLAPVGSALARLRKASRSHTKVTATRAMLRVEEVSSGKAKVTEIPVDELEELLLPTWRSVLQNAKMTGSGKRRMPNFEGDTGIPRLPDGRPVPRFLSSLMKFVGSPGITAVSDKATVTFGKGLPEGELAYLYALVRNALLR